MASLRRVIVREAVEGDAAAVTALWTEVYADAGPEGRRDPYSLQEYFAVAAAAEVSVVEDEGGAVVGVVALFAPGARGRSPQPNERRCSLAYGASFLRIRTARPH